MSHPNRDAPASPRRPRHDTRAVTRVLQQNADGDLVVPAEVGEIVLLPRLWDFAFIGDAAGRVELAHGSGLTASLDLDADGGVRLTAVVADPVATSHLRLAAS